MWVKSHVQRGKKYAKEMIDVESFVTLDVHKEFARRIDAENERQNRRIALLEENIKQMNALTISVEKMAVNMENMLNAIERQGNLIEKQNDRLDAMEKEPGKDYKQIKSTIITAIISAIATTVVGAIIAAVALL